MCDADFYVDHGYNNQYSTPYGAQGAADGGGFIGGDVQSSPAAGKVTSILMGVLDSSMILIVAQGGYGKETLRPLTVKQILEAHQPHADADFKVDGQAVSQVYATHHR